LDLRLNGRLLVSRLGGFLSGDTKCGARSIQLIAQLVDVQTGP
jgi:hypothetical protein